MVKKPPIDSDERGMVCGIAIPTLPDFGSSCGKQVWQSSGGFCGSDPEKNMASEMAM